MVYKSGENTKSIAERRRSERRVKNRRCDNTNTGYNGVNKRMTNQDRRLTIYNRHNIEVTDRRAEN